VKQRILFGEDNYIQGEKQEFEGENFVSEEEFNQVFAVHM